MKLRRFANDEDAVSPVIGVVLMVAITVILAAVIASFVLGFSDDRLEGSPQASIAFDYDQQSSGDQLTVTYEGGDTLDASNVNATVHGADQSSGDAVFGAEATGSGDDGKLFGDSGGVTAGTAHALDDSDFHDGGSSISGDLDLSEATVNVIYEDPSGDSSTVLARWEGPDA